MTYENRKNGHGYTISEPGYFPPSERLIFPSDATDIFYDATAIGSYLVEGGVGAGKTHLLRDIGRIARGCNYDLPTMTFRAHINGGSRSGVSNALREIDSFASNRGSDGLILFDNVDYYGYAGCKRKRSYGLALAHTAVANYMTELLSEDDRPIIIGTAHDEQWRSAKWKFPERMLDCDEVTPVAQQFIDSFAARRNFDGQLDQLIAYELLTAQNGFSEKVASSIISKLGDRDRLTYCVVSRLKPDELGEVNLEGTLREIKRGTLIRMGLPHATDESSIMLTHV